MPAGWKPRELLVKPREFGRTSNPEWLPREWDARLAAAVFQHRVSRVVIRWEGARAAHTLDDVAADLDLTVGYLRQKLYGHVPMSVEEVMGLTLSIGLDVLPASPREVRDLFNDDRQREETVARRQAQRNQLLG